MRAVLVSRYPRVDTKAWKQRVAADLIADGVDVFVLYSQAGLADQVRAGIREEGPGVLRRYMALRGRTSSGPGMRATRSLADWAAERGVPVERRRRLADAVHVLREIAPDLLVLVGADLVPAPVLAIPRLGTINAHYALLPEFRGMNVAEWSVFRGEPVGVTVQSN